ncbi:MAG TPA: membrane protein insertion efficiency factor YidD [Vicinamibacterales bacterium]|nr:membrane protein insertion efficiency factor YidD [Vicinamibacterales bacterium]
MRRGPLTLAIVVAALLILAAPLGPRLAVAAIHGYQRAFSPLLGRVGVRCRFTPTCSHYAEVVIAREGLIAGGWKAARRIARCGPWTAPGTRDDP